MNLRNFVFIFLLFSALGVIAIFSGCSVNEDDVVDIAADTVADLEEKQKELEEKVEELESKVDDLGSKIEDLEIDAIYK